MICLSINESNLKQMISMVFHMNITSTFTNFTTILIIFQWNVFKFTYDPLKTLRTTMYRITQHHFCVLIFLLIFVC